LYGLEYRYSSKGGRGESYWYDYLSFLFFINCMTTVVSSEKKGVIKVLIFILMSLRTKFILVESSGGEVKGFGLASDVAWELVIRD